MNKVGHGHLSLTRDPKFPVFPQIEIEVDVFQTEENELKFFYNPERNPQSFLTIELHSLESKAKRDEDD